MMPSLSLATFCWPNPLFALSFLFSASCAHQSQERLWWTEGSCSGEASWPWLLIKHEACYTRKYLRGSGNLRWSAAYISFWTPFRAAYNQGQLTIKGDLQSSKCGLWSYQWLLLRHIAYPFTCKSQCSHRQSWCKQCTNLCYSHARQNESGFGHGLSLN